MNSRKAILNQSPLTADHLPADYNASVYSARRLGHELRQRQPPLHITNEPLLTDTPSISEAADLPKASSNTLRIFLLLALSALAGYFYFDTTTPAVISPPPPPPQAPVVVQYAPPRTVRQDNKSNDSAEISPDPLITTLTAEYQSTLQTLRDLQLEIQELKHERSLARTLVSEHEAVESEKIASVTDEMLRMKESMETLQRNLEAKANEATQLRSDIEKVASAHQDATRAQIKSLLELEDARHRQEHKKIVQVSEVEIRNDEAKESDDIFNAACLAVGARVILAETSRSLQVNPIMSTMGKMLSNLVPNQRFQPVLEQDLPGPNVVLDSQGIRGPGDSFCVEGNQLQISILLGAPVFGKVIEIEHVRPSLDRHPHFAPDSVKAVTYSSRKDEYGLPFSAQEIETITADLDFGKKWKVHLPLNSRDEQIKQLRLTFTRRDSQSHMCVYRVRVMAGLKPETIL